MNLSWDPEKRALTLERRGLDFNDARLIFDGPIFTMPDERMDYGEERFVTFGLLSGRMVAMVWTPRQGGRRIISLRHANEREIKRYLHRLG